MADGELVLQKLDSGSFSIIATYDLGDATDLEVDERHYWAVPSSVLTISDAIIVAGRMRDVAGNGFAHIAESDDQGTPASWTIVEDTWGTDIALAVKTKQETGGSGIDYLAVRGARNAWRPPDD